jgi:hypothetical protein
LELTLGKAGFCEMSQKNFHLLAHRLRYWKSLIISTLVQFTLLWRII